jgi:phosphotransferase system enzyme I (PtsI)
MIGQVVVAFNAAGKPVSVCGEMGGQPAAAALLLGMGMRKLSMGAAQIAGVKRMLRGITIAECEQHAKMAAGLATAKDVEEYLCKNVPF